MKLSACLPLNGPGLGVEIVFVGGVGTAFRTPVRHRWTPRPGQ
jgi:hypothetical protein